MCVFVCVCVCQGDNRQSDGAGTGAEVLLFRGGGQSELRRELQDTSRELSKALFNSNRQGLELLHVRKHLCVVFIMCACLCVDVHIVLLYTGHTSWGVLETQVKALILGHERDLKKKDSEEYYTK